MVDRPRCHTLTGQFLGPNDEGRGYIGIHVYAPPPQIGLRKKCLYGISSPVTQVRFCVMTVCAPVKIYTPPQSNSCLYATGQFTTPARLSVNRNRQRRTCRLWQLSLMKQLIRFQRVCLHRPASRGPSAAANASLSPALINRRLAGAGLLLPHYNHEGQRHQRVTRPTIYACRQLMRKLIKRRRYRIRYACVSLCTVVQ